MRGPRALPITRLVSTALPSKPSLAGLSKTELAEKLIAVGVESKKAKMRAEQLWRWI